MRGKLPGPGPGLRGTQLLFPLSPEIAVVGTFEKRHIDFTVSPLHVAAFNGATISNARRQVYCRDRMAHYVLDDQDDPKPCLQLLSDTRFKTDKSEMKKWY